MMSLRHETKAFEYIELKDAFEVYITEDSVFSVEITANENNVDQISVEVEDNVLYVRDNRENKWLEPENNRISIYITSSRLKEIIAAEGCKIETLTPVTSNGFGIIFTGRVNEAALDLNCGTFYYWNDHPCGGRLTLTGEVNRLNIWNFALVSVDAKNLTANYANVENSSKGNCEITVLNRLIYSITGEGNICLYGNPEEIIEQELTSSGRLMRY